MNWSARPKATLVFAATLQVAFSLHIVVQPLGRFAASAVLAAASAETTNRALGIFIVYSLVEPYTRDTRAFRTVIRPPVGF